MTDLKALLLAQRDLERDVEIPGIGTVRVRGLRRDEILAIREDTNGGEDRREFDIRVVALAMVDPAMTIEEVTEWFDVAPAGEYETILSAASEATGMVQGAGKSAVPAVRRKRR